MVHFCGNRVLMSVYWEWLFLHSYHMSLMPWLFGAVVVLPAGQVVHVGGLSADALPAAVW